MIRYLLDTNTVSHLLRKHPTVAQRVVAVPMSALRISAVTEAELMVGLARRPDALRLHAVVEEFLRRMDVLPWDGAVAERYGPMRARLEEQGKTLAPLDMLIAAHALDSGIVLVTSDRAFSQVEGLRIEDWTSSPAEPASSRKRAARR
jgi:tRNA(fMet)-specific endonuclease VapC